MFGHKQQLILAIVRCSDLANVSRNFPMICPVVREVQVFGKSNSVMAKFDEILMSVTLGTGMGLPTH